MLESPLWNQGPHWLTDKFKWPQWKQTEVLHLQTETITDTDEPISAEIVPQTVDRKNTRNRYSQFCRYLTTVLYQNYYELQPTYYGLLTMLETQ